MVRTTLQQNLCFVRSFPIKISFVINVTEKASFNEVIFEFYLKLTFSNFISKCKSLCQKRSHFKPVKSNMKHGYEKLQCHTTVEPSM